MVIDELRARCAPLRFAPLPGVVTEAPSGPEWITAAGIADPADPFLGRLLDADAAEPPGPRAVHTLRTLLRELIFCTAGAVYLLEAAPQLGPDRYVYRTTGPGRSGGAEDTVGAAVLDRVVVVGHEAVIGPARGGALPVTDRAELDAWLAPGFVATVRPLVEIVAARTRVGPRTLWSYVIDMVHFGMLNLARQLERDRAAAWERAGELAEQLFAAGVPRRSEPAMVRFGPENEQVWGVRGACCLDFTDGAHGMCLTCPLLAADDRAEKWAAADLSGPR